MSTVTAISFKPKATRKRLKKEILNVDFKKRKIFWKNIAENFLENFPYGKIFHLTSLAWCGCDRERSLGERQASGREGSIMDEVP
jgi:hypothetical protein